jgi:type I restriction-modification system DNA methylase subunit
MGACVVIFQTTKSQVKKGKIYLTNAFSEISHKRTIRFLIEEHVEQIVNSFRII